MKTIRLLYPDYVSGGLETYHFGANLMRYILPENPDQSVIQVTVDPPEAKEKTVTNGIYAEQEVLSGIRSAQQMLHAEDPDRVITIGGNCLVSLAPFDYLHGKYGNTGIIWIDAHPDITVPADYSMAHTMVLGSLLGYGAPQLRDQMQHGYFQPEEVLYVGLQPVLEYQEQFLSKIGVEHKAQDRAFVSDDEIKSFLSRFDHILVHFDIDVLDEHFFHSTYFANPNLIGDGASGGRMKIEQLTDLLHLIENNSDIVGFTIAEYLPFDEHNLHRMFSGLNIFTA